MACPFFRESTRFLERKLGKELCAKLRFASGMIAQLPRFCQSRRCYFNCTSFKFLISRPQWAGARKIVRPGFARRTQVPIFQEGVPRNRGSRGTTPMSARRAKALIEGVPLAHLWFLSVRAERNIRLSTRKPAPQGGTNKKTTLPVSR